MSKTSSTFRSDALPQARDLLAMFAEFGALVGSILCLRVIIDSNVVLDDLRWLVTERRDPASTTPLIESIAAGVVVAYAPNELRHEVEKHLADRAEAWGVDLAVLRAEWEVYGSSLKLLDVSEVEAPATPEFLYLRNRDASDLPFLLAMEFLGAMGVCSRDNDILASGAPIVPFEVMFDLRRYARAKSVEVHITVVGSFAGLMVVAPTFGIIRALVDGIRALATAPCLVKIAVGIGVAVLLLHPRARARVAEALRWAGQQVVAAWQSLEPHISRLSDELTRARAEASGHEARIGAALEGVDHGRPVTLKQAAFSVIATASAGPVPLEDVRRGVLRHGYSPKGKPAGFARYLRHVLREGEQFVEDNEGRWALRRASAVSL